jgi:hypothetical protein
MMWREASKHAFKNVFEKLAQCLKVLCSSWSIFRVSIFIKNLREGLRAGFCTHRIYSVSLLGKHRRLDYTFDAIN